MTRRISNLNHKVRSFGLFLLLMCLSAVTACCQDQPTPQIRVIRGTTRGVIVPRGLPSPPLPEQTPEVTPIHLNQQFARKLLHEASLACFRGELDVALGLAKSAHSLNTPLTPEETSPEEMISALRRQIAARDRAPGPIYERVSQSPLTSSASPHSLPDAAFATDGGSWPAPVATLQTPETAESLFPNSRGREPWSSDRTTVDGRSRQQWQPLHQTAESNSEQAAAPSTTAAEDPLANLSPFEHALPDTVAPDHPQVILPAGFRVAVEPNVAVGLNSVQAGNNSLSDPQHSFLTAQMQHDGFTGSWYPACWAGAIGVILGSLTVMATCVLLQNQRSRPGIMRLQLDGATDLAKLLNSVSLPFKRESSELPTHGVVVDLSAANSKIPFKLGRTFTDQQAVTGELERKRARDICETLFAQNLEFQTGLLTSAASA